MMSQKEPVNDSLKSLFIKLTPEMIQERKIQSQLPLKKLPEDAMELGFEDLYLSESERLDLDFPTRPDWSKKDSKATLEAREEAYFQHWIENLFKSQTVKSLGNMSYFEQNLQVWRQLWRVLEISDIILLVVDSRHPVIQFPPTLYDYIANVLKKNLVLIFNKIDLIGQETLRAWTEYFRSQFPDLGISCFSCYPTDGFLENDTGTGIHAFAFFTYEN